MNVSSFKYKNVILGTAATAVGYYAVLAPHTTFLNKYRYMVGRHQVGKEVPLDFEIRQKVQQVMDDLKLPNKVRNFIKPFSTFGFDLLNAGTLNAKYGAILGIPANFTNTAEELRKNLQIKEEPIDWTRQDAQNFLNALMFSENAQKFAIAREILRIQAEEPYSNSFRLALIIGILWTCYNVIVYKFKLRQWNVMLCRALYLTLILFGAILWVGIKDYYSYQLDKENDETLCSLGTEYIKGGQEFYEKTLIRNRALRSLLGEKGKDVYTTFGNEQTLLRQRHVPISHRKDFFDSYLQNLNCRT